MQNKRPIILFKLTEQLRTFGLKKTIQTCLSVIQDKIFETRYGLDTADALFLDELDFSASDTEHANDYWPTRIRHLTKLFEEINIATDGLGFVDFGCGKGRILFFVTRYNFSKIVGIELSNDLTIVARNNMEKFCEKKTVNTPIEILNMNALDYETGGDDHVYYFFRPFDDVVMKAVIDNILESLTQSPRLIWIIINNTTYDSLLNNYTQLKKTHTFYYAAANFVVYKNS